MTLHIHYDHTCPECGTAYIPYDENVPCPVCGLVEEERFHDFVPRAAASARYNLQRGGRYVPPAWGAFSFADNILYILFEVLEAYRKHEGEQPFEAVAADFLGRSHFQDNAGYLRGYLLPLACRVHEELQGDEE